MYNNFAYMELTLKQENFCNYFLESGNASEAYRRAYSCSRMQDKTVWRMACELMDNPKVSARIKELQNEQRKKSDIKKDDILMILKNIMYADIRNFLTIKNGEVHFKDSDEWTEDMAMQVESVRQTRDGIEIKLNGRAWSIQRICKMLGFDAPQELNLNASNRMSMDDARKIISEIQ